MGHGLLSVARRAFKEALSEIRLDTPVRIVTGIIAPIVSAAIVWWLTGSPAWGGMAGVVVLLTIGVLVFGVKMFTVPLALANEAKARLDALEQQIAETAAKPAPRDPDGIYQHGRKVGRVRGATPRLNEGMIGFVGIDADGDFQGETEFEYRDFRLTITHCDTSGTVSIMGVPPQQGFNNVSAIVLGRT